MSDLLVPQTQKAVSPQSVRTSTPSRTQNLRKTVCQTTLATAMGFLLRILPFSSPASASEAQVPRSRAHGFWHNELRGKTILDLGKPVNQVGFFWRLHMASSLCGVDKLPSDTQYTFQSRVYTALPSPAAAPRMPHMEGVVLDVVLQSCTGSCQRCCSVVAH
ncbi:hypothetical protein FKP32DRAFT_1594380 [Trametes sanguinea]|nr:hypothetical protein FKP32DRAFT_1594380 [Trametes sanguinea]